MKESIFPIPGINSNIKYGDVMFHVQTEVIQVKKLVTTHIYTGGEIVHADFASFKKHYDSLIDSDPQKLRAGLVKLVKLMHQKGLTWLKDNYNPEKRETSKDTGLKCSMKPLVQEWLMATTKNLKEDFPDLDIVALTYNTVEMKLESISDDSNQDAIDDSVFITLSTIVQNHIPKLFNMPTRLAYIETDRRKIFIIPLNQKLSGIMIFNNDQPTGLLKMEIKRYTPLLEQFRNPKVKLPDLPDYPSSTAP